MQLYGVGNSSNLVFLVQKKVYFIAERPRIHLLNCRGSTSPRSAPTQLCQCVCVVRGGEGDGMSGQKGSLQDPSAPPSRLQGRNKEPRYEVLEDNGLQPGKDLPNSPRQD